MLLTAKPLFNPSLALLNWINIRARSRVRKEIDAIFSTESLVAVELRLITIAILVSFRGLMRKGGENSLYAQTCKSRLLGKGGGW